MPALSLTCIFPASFTLRLRWLLVLATVTYLNKLPWTHTLAALPQREILWVTPFPGTPSLVESGVIFMGTACGGRIILSPHPGPLPKGAREKNTAPNDPLSPMGRGLG
ncbi:MAG TPA: hypothetical protein DEF87_03560 [Enterobacter asburiae]|nr:hypothetical protein DP195_06050 [Enterobacter asburiae]HBW93194.1 hypothetical protein [Enterobacter asburiae]